MGSSRDTAQGIDEAAGTMELKRSRLEMIIGKLGIELPILLLMVK
jgi:hypothetical protein